MNPAPPVMRIRSRRLSRSAVVGSSYSWSLICGEVIEKGDGFQLVTLEISKESCGAVITADSRYFLRLVRLINLFQFDKGGLDYACSII